MSAKSKALVKFLSEGGEGQRVALSPVEQIGGVHYTWIAEGLDGESKPLQSLFLASLPEEMAQPLAKWLPEGNLSLSNSVRNFLLVGLIQRLFPRGVLPVACLPSSPLTPLLKLSKRTTVRLVGLLGLHDLALEMRQTLDKRAILKIQQLLTPMQRAVLERCMRGQDILPASAYGLEKWGAGSHQLQMIAEKQGLMRLGKALANEERSLLWHLAHKLDTGRGKLLIHYGTGDVSSTISKRLTGQILELVQELGE
ncbi:MAG: hypothetical protein AB7F31_02815 [Parachlamydiales bacterium]